jgi:hypothetical protein
MCSVYGHEGDEEGEYVTYGDEVKRDADSDGNQCYRRHLYDFVSQSPLPPQ